MKSLGERLLEQADHARDCDMLDLAGLLEEAAREVGLPGMSLEEARTLRNGDKLKVVWCGQLQRETDVPFGAVVTLVYDCTDDYPTHESDALECELPDGSEFWFYPESVVRMEEA